MNFKSRRTVRIEIETRIKAGESKQAIYQDLKRQYDNDPFIRKVLSEVPSLDTREKFARFNQILIILMSCIAAVKVAFAAAGMTAYSPSIMAWLLLQDAVLH